MKTVLLLGSGGREHALAWKLAQSEDLRQLFVAPGNDGMATIAECVDLDIAVHQDIIAFCDANSVDLVVVGPEIPLVAGIADDLRAAGIAVFGPSKAAAQLEGSKGFTKALCDRADIPTAAYQRFSNLDDARSYIIEQGVPIVVKADGLAAGKGVVVAHSLPDAVAAVEDIFAGKYGKDAGAEVVIEDFLNGEEASFFAITDGETTVPFGTAQDHKRAFDGDVGPNTGGMGAYSPTPILTDETDILERIIRPTVETLASEGTPFQGVLYAGLMMTDEGPHLIEYNVRFGDPECQVLMMRLESDLLEIMYAAATQGLAEITPKWKAETALTVIMAADGYPGQYQKGETIRGIADAEAVGARIFHAGTRKVDDVWVSNGGRVLAVTACGSSVTSAASKAYDALAKIDWPGGMFRRDIGWRAIEKEQGQTED
ncbi:MAG: phosphoribosylamine--glycine ligase [Pseudomonadota bacterium]